MEKLCSKTKAMVTEDFEPLKFWPLQRLGYDISK